MFISVAKQQKKEKRWNLPGKGANVTVQPIRDVEAIKQIKKNLESKPRDNLLFTLGINNGIRMCDLLRLGVGQVKGKQVGEIVEIKEYTCSSFSS